MKRLYVLSQLDYCNSILFGLPANLIWRLQSVQNAVTRLIFRIRQSEHITPALISLHWLSVLEHIYFKLAVMTYRSIHCTSRPIYSRVSPAFPTWHPDDGCSLLPHIVWTFHPFVSLQSAGGRFRFLVPPNDLPLHVASAPSLAVFRQRLDLSVFPFLPRHYHMTRVLPFVTTVWTH